VVGEDVRRHERPARARVPLAQVRRDGLRRSDSDGDSVLDGADDEDHDGFTNAFEVRRPANWALTFVSELHPGTNPRARVQPFNPCKPYYSSKCHVEGAWPIGYYIDPQTKAEEDWRSPVRRNGPE
jgi:hypothetical protein